MLIHGVELVVHPDHRPLLQGLATPADVLQRWGAEIPPASRRSAVAELRLPEGHYFLKVYAYAGLWRLRTVFIVSRARREYLNLFRMAAFGFRVPQPVAYGQSRSLGFVSESFVMTRAIEGAVSLRALVDDPKAAPFPSPSREDRRRLIDGFARTLRRAHDEGYFVHTLRAKNLLLTHDGAQHELHVIDVPFAGILRWRLFPQAGRVRDLAVLMKWARVLLTRGERMRFAKVYGADAALLRKAQAYQEHHYP